MTQFQYLPLSKAYKASGIVVVVDVLRAFTTAAYAFSLGAEKIFPVDSVEDAFKIKERFPGSLLLGEVDGYKPVGFDYSNSPYELINQGLDSKALVQRTSAGTQGIIRTKSCETVIAASFVVAKATAFYLETKNPTNVSFIITGNSQGRDGDEDQACAAYIQALIERQHPDPKEFTKRVSTSSVGMSFLAGDLAYLSQEDIVLSTQTDIFNFAMVLSVQEDPFFLFPRLIR